jgi:C-terminal processing protease CtpA/Prc
MLLLLASLALAEVVNPSFDLGNVGEVPTGWLLPEVAVSDGYRAERTRDGTVLLRSEGPTESFATLSQTLDVAPYRGKRIRLSGRVRSRTGAGQAGGQLWLRIDRNAGTLGFFDNMEDRPVLTRAWTDVSIVGGVAADARGIVFGLLLSGEGAMEADDLRIDVLGPVEEGNTPPAPVSEGGVDNLVALARLGGVVELFHPSPGARAVEWARLLAAAVAPVEGVGDAEALAHALRAVVALVAPSVEVWAGGPEMAPVRTPPRGPLLLVEHHGLGPTWTGMDPERSVYYSPLRIRAAARVPDGDEVVVVPLGAGVMARVPLALEAAARPKVDGERGAAGGGPEGWAPSDADRGSRVAAVMRTWSVLRHFYPYDVGVDWDIVLREAISAAAEQADLQPVLERLVAAIHDGHGYVSGPARDFYTLPIALVSLAEGVVVARTWGEPGPLRPGDVLRTIDGLPVSVTLENLRAHTSFATEGWARFETMSALAARSTGAPVVLSVQHIDGTAEDVSIAPVPARRAAEPPIPRPAQGTELAPGVRYLDLTTVTEDELAAMLHTLVAAEAVVIDMRGYPGAAAVPLLQHLATRRFESARWMVPHGVRPFAEPMEWDTRGRWQLAPRKPRITGRVAFLVDGGVISYAESIMGIVEAERLGTIVGAPTAGTNGNINTFSPLRGYGVTFTGMRVLKHDGSPHHGVGIVPTVPAVPTRAGLAAGVDEVLAAGVEAVRHVDQPQ